MKERILTVSQVSRYLKNLLSTDYVLTGLSVSGEVSDMVSRPNGHIYFSIKDENALLKCVIFAGARRTGLGFPMRNGDQVVVRGRVDLYDRGGQMQVIASRIERQGAGDLYERFLALKNRLEEMGMFSQQYKRPIPRYIHRLGVVTSPSGAALQDIKSVSFRRNPYLQILLAPARVQGEGAAETIAEGIRRLDAEGVDLIIVGRGGGSIEDLWAFNEEIVARAIFDCETPVISAVGHETDFTIADYVADLRAPTPSAAAELAVDDIHELIRKIDESRRRMEQIMQMQLRYHIEQARRIYLSLQAASPKEKLKSLRFELEKKKAGLDERMRERLAGSERQLAILAERFEGLSPLKRLSGGYAYVRSEQGECLTRIAQAKAGELLEIHVTDGAVLARTERTLPLKRSGAGRS